MNLMKLIEGTYVLLEEAADDGAAAGGGSIIGSAGAEDSGAEGSAEEGSGDAGKDDAAGGADDEATGKPDGEEGKDDDSGEQEGAPEKYEDFVIPEGMTANPEALAEFQEFAKARNLSQKDAQEVLDYHSKEVAKLFTAQEEAWTEVKKGWVDTAKSDKEYGGTNFKENMKHVAVALKNLGTPELKDALDQTGLGDHPELVRFFYRVGKLVGEADFRTGNGDSTGQKDAASVLYPNMN